MHVTEKMVIAVRHNKYLSRANWAWDKLRPLYDKFLGVTGRGGLKRVINGSDTILISPKLRMVWEEYEPEVWRGLMAHVRPGDVIADVGTYIGLYTIALAKRVGPAGRVFAFEPDVVNVATLKEHIRLNEVGNRVEVIQAAVGSQNGWASFSSNQCQSHILEGQGDDPPVDGSYQVECITLDRVFENRRLDILKVDVEGYEEMVLKGATNLLSDASRSPRVIYVEVHPYAWSGLGTDSSSLLSLLASFNYRVEDVSGNPVEQISEYGEIVAHKLA